MLLGVLSDTAGGGDGGGGVGDIYTALLIRGGSISDATAHANTVTNLYGGVSLSNVPSPVGPDSLYFNGYGCLTVPDKLEFRNYPGSVGTIDFWMKNTAICFPYYKGDGNGAPSSVDQLCQFWGPGDLRICFNYAQYASGQHTWFTVGAMDDDVWHHLAFVKDGNMGYVFVDGILISSGSMIDNIAATTHYPLAIGGAEFGGFMQGYLDEFRISTIARWTANFTPPTTRY